MGDIGERMRRRAVLAWLFVGATLATSFALAQDASLASLRPTIAREYPEVRWITAVELDAAMRRRPHARPRLLDARTPDEYAVSHLRDATRIDPDHPDIASLGRDRARAVVVYCAVGYRSAAITRSLMRAGFGDVRNLEGGIFGWANAGRPVYRDGRIVHDVHPYDETWGRMLRPELRTLRPRR